MESTSALYRPIVAFPFYLVHFNRSIQISYQKVELLRISLWLLWIVLFDTSSGCDPSNSSNGSHRNALYSIFIDIDQLLNGLYFSYLGKKQNDTATFPSNCNKIYDCIRMT